MNCAPPGAETGQEHIQARKLFPVVFLIGIRRDNLAAIGGDQRPLGHDVQALLDEPHRAIAQNALTPPGWKP